MQFRGGGKERLVDRRLHQDELLRDADGDRVIAHGGDRKEGGDDQPVDMKDHLHGGLVDEFHGAETQQLGKRRAIEAGAKTDLRHQAAGHQHEDNQRDDVDGDGDQGQAAQSAADLDRHDLRHGGGGAQRQRPAGEEIEPLQSLGDGHEQEQHHVAGKAGGGNVEHEARIGP